MLAASVFDQNTEQTAPVSCQVLACMYIETALVLASRAGVLLAQSQIFPSFVVPNAIAVLLSQTHTGV